MKPRKFSKTLHRVAESDDRVQSYEFDPGNDSAVHWLHLEWPFVWEGSAFVHEDTVKECLECMRDVRVGTKEEVGEIG